MITNFKIFESNDDIYFSVGDEVICIDGEKDDINSNIPKELHKYLVLRIYEEIFNSDCDSEIINHQYVTKKDIDYFFVDVKNIKTNMISKQWLASRFMTELRTATNKFNL